MVYHNSFMVYHNSFMVYHNSLQWYSKHVITMLNCARVMHSLAWHLILKMQIMSPKSIYAWPFILTKKLDHLWKLFSRHGLLEFIVWVNHRASFIYLKWNLYKEFVVCIGLCMFSLVYCYMLILVWCCMRVMCCKAWVWHLHFDISIFRFFAAPLFCDFSLLLLFCDFSPLPPFWDFRHSTHFEIFRHTRYLTILRLFKLWRQT